MATDSNNLQLTSPSPKASKLVLKLAINSLVPKIAKLASSYPHPHHVLGRASASHYVEKLAMQNQHPGTGWYLVERFDEVVAAAHLTVYGLGDGSGHTLWKIRHPLLAPGCSADCLTFLFNGLVETAIGLRPGTGKFVVFLSEFEQNAMVQAGKSGFQREARFENYYRLGETCFVYGRTVA